MKYKWKIIEYKYTFIQYKWKISNIATFDMSLILLENGSSMYF